MCTADCLVYLIHGMHGLLKFTIRTSTIIFRDRDKLQTLVGSVNQELVGAACTASIVITYCVNQELVGVGSW
jgi:hypothetical protein